MAEEKENRRYVFLPNHIHLSVFGTNLELTACKLLRIKKLIFLNFLKDVQYFLKHQSITAIELLNFPGGWEGGTDIPRKIGRRRTACFPKLQSAISPTLFKT